VNFSWLALGSVVITGFVPMTRVIVVVIAARCVIVVLLFCWVGMQVAVGMLMGVFVKMFVLCAGVAMGMRMEMLVKMAVLVFMLQTANGAAASLPIGER
jgi:hypothetical protein